MPKSSRKWQTVRIIVILILGALGYHGLRQTFPSPESEYAQYQRYKQEARQAMMEECTNQLIGLNKIVNVNFVDFYPDIHDWRGDITAEFVDGIGGVERTNLSFRFALHKAGVGYQVWTNAGLDYEWMAKQSSARRKADFDAWLANLDSKNSSDNQIEIKPPTTLQETVNGAFGWKFGQQVPAGRELSDEGAIEFNPKIEVYRQGILFCREDRSVYKIVACADNRFKQRVLADLKRRFGPGEDFDYGESCRWENDSQEIKLMRLDDGFAVVYTDKTR